MTKPTSPYQPYAAVHEKPNGPGDARPTALQIIQDCDAIGKLRGRTVLITGCSTGLGVETARALYVAGATLFLTARDMPRLNGVIDDIVTQTPNKGSSATPPRPEPLELHLDSLASVRSAAEEFTRRSNGQLDILIENAGVMATPFGRTRDGFETQMGTNHFAHFLLFQLLKPLLLRTAAANEGGLKSRVVVLSSAGHRMSGVRLDDPNWVTGEAEYTPWAGYGQSKTANIYMAAALNRHYAARGLVASSVHPGGIPTELGKHLTEEDRKRVQQPELKPMYKSLEQGAATTVWAAVSPHFEDARNGGRYLGDCGECGPAKGALGFVAAYQPHIYNEDAEEKLWKLSYEAVGLPVED